MKKKLVAALLSATMVVSLVAGCGQSKAPNETKETKAESTEGAAGTEGTASADNAAEDTDPFGYASPVTIKVGYSAWGSDFGFAEGQDSSNNDWVELYKEHNIVPEILYEVDPSQAKTKLSAAIMSGDYPDLIEADAADYVNYAKTGVIADITEAYEKYATDELKQYLMADEGLSLQSCYIDGKLYGLPKMNSPYDFAPVMFIRQDWLDKLNLEKPQNMEELKKVAIAFTNDDPDGNGKNDTYGLALDGVNILNGSFGDVHPIFQCFGAYPGKESLTFLDDGNGNVIWGGEKSEEMKNALTFLNDLYNEGAVTKDFITMDDNTINEEIGSGRCGIWFGPMWVAMGGAGTLLKDFPEARITSAPLPDGTGKGENKTFLPNSFTTAFCLSSKCENPELLVKIMNLSVQKLCHPANNEEFEIYYGSEGHSGWKTALTWTLEPLKNYDNWKKDTEALATGDTSKLNAEQSSDYANMRAYLDAIEAGVIDPEDGKVTGGAGLYTVFGGADGSYAALDYLMQNDGYITACYQGMTTENMAKVSPTLKKMFVETCVKIITGQQDVDSYDEFLENWRANGGTDVVKEAQEWYDSNK